MLNSFKWSLCFHISNFNLAQWHCKCGLGRLPSMGFRMGITGKWQSPHEGNLRITAEQVMRKSLWLFFLYPATDNRSYLHLTILHLTPSIHKQISYFILFPWQHLTFHVCWFFFFFFKEGKVKITLSVKLNISPSPHLFIHRHLGDMVISHSFQKFNASFLL